MNTGRTKTSGACTWKTTSGRPRARIRTGPWHLPRDWPSEDIDNLVRKSSGYYAAVIKFLSSGKRILARLLAILDFDSTSTNCQVELQIGLLYEHLLNSAGAEIQTTALCILFARTWIAFKVTKDDVRLCHA